MDALDPELQQWLKDCDPAFDDLVELLLQNHAQRCKLCSVLFRVMSLCTLSLMHAQRCRALFSKVALHASAVVPY